MPSLKTVFLLATAALAAFTSASPLAAPRDVAATSPLSGLAGAGAFPNPASVLEQRKDLIQATQPIVILTESGREMMAGMLVAATDSAGKLLLTVAHVVGLECHSPRHESESKPTSLAVILLALKAKLDAVLEKLTTIIGGKSSCDVELLKPILEEIHAILTHVFEEVKGLIGLSIDVILCLDGKVLAVIDIAHILAEVLTLLCSILAMICKVLDAAGLKAIAAILGAISALVANILGVIFHILADLLKCLVPLLDNAIKVLIELKLEAILNILQVAH